MVCNKTIPTLELDQYEVLLLINMLKNGMSRVLLLAIRKTVK